MFNKENIKNKIMTEDRGSALTTPMAFSVGFPPTSRIKKSLIFWQQW